MNKLSSDYKRYKNKRDMPKFQYYLRKTQCSRGVIKIIYRILLKHYRLRNCVDIGSELSLGEGCYFGHPYAITIAPTAVIGRNCNIHKGVTIGRENRGIRKGAPVIGDCVWIGINSTIVGNIHIGNDVLIAPNTYINCDIPDYSVVFGNPCIIKHRDNATEGYINRKN